MLRRKRLDLEKCIKKFALIWYAHVEGTARTDFQLRDIHPIPLLCCESNIFMFLGIFEMEIFIK